MNLISAFGQSAYVAAVANAIQITSGFAAIAAWWHLSCGQPGCWRHGRHAHGEAHYCGKHRPR